MIREALEAVRAEIDAAALAAGRAPAEIELCAVSKTKPASSLREAYAACQRVFGENYAQELADKRAELADLPGLVLRMIGHVQTNKARVVARIADAVDTVDRPELARELGRRAAAAGRVLSVMIEVNVGGEAQKHGVSPDRLGEVLDAVAREPSLALEGLMTVPPHTEDPAGARPYFARLRALRDAHGGARALPRLSMGMSHDFREAILEGSTMVRVGSAIFGAR
ncbi:MAG: YggS family pyridoxal phosphate-dependent enzyme [Polyangiaceae bacterium]|nr:YggS family pyridoxal phosphate-dependent enzyme [Polyangiaceae bacterium]